MIKSLNDFIKFRGDKLFNGAVNIDWLFADKKKAFDASKAFVFHGPDYHGVSQSVIGSDHGHKLQDTASFALSIIRRCYGIEEQPFTLAIAGYGTGKSHFGLTVANLIGNPVDQASNFILDGIKQADEKIGVQIASLIKDVNQPVLVVALNGMRSFDLASEMSSQIIRQLQGLGLNTRALEDLRPRFSQAVSLIKMAEGNDSILGEILSACDVGSIETVLERLNNQDDETYRLVYGVFEKRNIKISSIGGESVRDVLEVSAREYCGPNKPFRSIVILFDEFGRYIEFATIKSHIAGSGVLQDLFEGIQAESSKVSFVGFIQFELNAYMQRVAPEFKNEMLRYVTRYQSANKVYLSINLETLIANLIEKHDKDYISSFLGSSKSKTDSKEILDNINKWYPVSKNHYTWTRSDVFHDIIRKGCWPLSPYSVWLLFYLAAAGKHLQERSVLALLDETFKRFQNKSFSDQSYFQLNPVDLWTDSLQHEFITSEEAGQQGAITHAYNTVIEKHRAQITELQQNILRAVVFSSKLSLKASNQTDAIRAISQLSGIEFNIAEETLRALLEEFNVIEWDESFKQYDIIGDAVPRSQFVSFLKNRVANSYTEVGRAVLFAIKATIFNDKLKNIDTDFAEKNQITTQEWYFDSTVTNLENIPLQLKACIDNWTLSVEIDQARGSVFYCYVEPSRDIEVTERELRKLIKSYLSEINRSDQPILVVLLYDSDGTVGQSLAEISTLDDDLSAQDSMRFGNLVNAHKEKLREDLKSRIDGLLKERRYVTYTRADYSSMRLDRVASLLFEQSFSKPLTFPFDGFTTSKGNAAVTCHMLTRELMYGRLDWNSIMSKPAKDQNRATSVLRDAWGIFDKGGTVLNRPQNRIIRQITENWDQQLNDGEQRLPLYTAIQELCRPPFGANIASAGLLLSVYLAARHEKLSILKSDRLISISEWLNDDIFKGKFIDIKGLYDVSLVFTGELASEWEIILEEWEHAESYSSIIDFYNKAIQLKNTTPLPPQKAYKVEYLNKNAEEAIRELKEYLDTLDVAVSKINEGVERNNLALIVYGGSEVSILYKKITSNLNKWDRNQLDEVSKHIENSRQITIHNFDSWLVKQKPNSGTPDEVGRFKHKMISKVGAGLVELNLPDLKEQLEKYTLKVIKDIEQITEARRFVQEVKGWLGSNLEAINLFRVAELRELLKTGKEYSSKLKKLYTRLDLDDIKNVQLLVVNRLEEISSAMQIAQDRALALWNTNIESLDHLERLQTEVNALFNIYDRCPEDLDDLQVMRRTLRLFLQVYLSLDDELLTEEKFVELVKKLTIETESALEEEEQPWDVNETISKFKDIILEHRQAKSSGWIESVLLEINSLEELPITDLNRLHNKISNPPAIITPKDHTSLVELRKVVDLRLGTMKVDWLIQMFNELPTELQKSFILKIK
jgi:hypothetical protein